MAGEDNTLADREFYQKIGICPRCRKNKLYGSEKQCPVCNSKAYASVMGTRDRVHYNKLHNEWAVKEYKRRKWQGICTRCGKRKASAGYCTCALCREKDRLYHYARSNKPCRKDRALEGLCYFCGSPVKNGFKVCEKHYRMCVENSRHRKAGRTEGNHVL